MPHNLYLQKENGGISLLLATLGHILDIASRDPQKTTTYVTIWVNQFRKLSLTISLANQK
jgi:hypothetical protein